MCSHTRFPTDDDNLIILDPIPGQEDCQSDYINACYVDVSVCMLSSLLWPLQLACIHLIYSLCIHCTSVP